MTKYRIRSFYKGILILSLALIAGCSASTQRGDAAPVDLPELSATRPNIIFIFTDDHAPHAISAYGSKINQTPNIDRLASEGMLFRRSYCANSICGPSRATILTGLHSHANGFMQNTAGGFDGSQQTFPKLLQKAGYQTAIFGKWHLKSQPTGFDKWMILPGQGAYYNPDFITPDGRVRIEGYCTDVTTDLTLQWLDEQRDPDKPFMLMCQHKAPHRTWMPGPNELSLYCDADIPEPATLFDDYACRGPALPKNRMEIDRHMRMAYDLQVVGPPVAGQDVRERKGARPAGLGRLTPEQLAAWDAAYAEDNAAFLKAQSTMSKQDIVRWKYQRYIKNYLRCVAGVDRNVGRVLDYLDNNPELAKNTIVIYSSDQGFYLGDHGWFDKRWMYEESFAMPLVVRWPGHIPAGIENTELVQNIDYAPTFLDLAGATPDKPMHGTSLVPLLEGDAELPGRDALYYHYYESPSEHRVTAHYGVATDRYKLIRHYGPEVYWELFDLQEDPDELTSVYGQEAYAQIQADLYKRLGELRQEFGNDIGSE